MVLNIHTKHKAYQGWGKVGAGGIGLLAEQLVSSVLLCLAVADSIKITILCMLEVCIEAII